MENLEILESLTKRVASDWDGEHEVGEFMLTTMRGCMVTLSMDDLLTWLRSTAYEIAEDMVDKQKLSRVPIVGASTPNAAGSSVPSDVWDKDDADKIVEQVSQTFIKKLYFNQTTDKGLELINFTDFVAGF